MLRLLGPVELVVNGRSVDLGGPRQRVVLSVLALNANRLTPMEQLIDAVWQASPPSTARTQIQICISALRKLFAGSGFPAVIDTRPAGYLLELPVGELDTEVFARQVRAARSEVDDGRIETAASTLRDALGVWRGPALAGLEGASPQRAAALLDERRRAAVDELVQLDLALGRHKELCGELRAMVAEQPLHERLQGFLMIALYRSGRPAEALEVFRQARKVFVEELGIEPGQELRDLELAILRRDPSIGAPTAGASTARGALGGGHAVESPVVPRQLPAGVADFTARDDSIAEAKRFLSLHTDVTRRSHAVPILVISGSGGVGKTTLAIRVAHELADMFPDGHLYSDLRSGTGEPRTAEVLARFLRALGVAGSAVPEDLQERAEMYRSRLAGKRVLVLLDDASDEEQVRPLLPGSPGCAVIVTSRARLTGLPGAYGIDIDVFDIESARELLAKIIGEARMTDEREAGAELARLCGGLPLAMRIAGARLASRPHWRIAGLVERLADEARRLDELAHHGLELRSNIAVTYRGLDHQAQRLFRLLALIKAPDVPGWTAAALLDVDVAHADDSRERLVEARLLDVVSHPNARGVRYRFHDLVRVYARERLLESEPATDRHNALARALSAWLAMAEEAHRMEYGGDDTILHGAAPRWRLRDGELADFIDPDKPMEWLDAERQALVAAVRQAAESGLDELCWDLAFTAMTLFETKGYFDDWNKTTQLGINATQRAGNHRGRAAMEYTMGVLHLFRMRLTEAEACFGTALEGFDAVQDAHGRALVLRNQAYIDGLHSKSAAMTAKYTEALETMRAVGDRMGAAHVLRSMAKFHMDDGETTAAREILEEAHVICREAKAARAEAQVLYRFAELHLITGEIDLARQAVRQVLRIVRDLDDRIGQAYALNCLGVVQRREGGLQQAESACRRALALARQLGERLVQGLAEHELGEVALAKGDHSTAAIHLTEAERLFAELGSVVWHAKTLLRLADAHLAGGDNAAAHGALDQAERLLAHSESKQAATLLAAVQSARSGLITEARAGDGQGQVVSS